MKNTSCIWCWSVIKVGDDFDNLRHKGVCSQSCKDAETLFCIHFADEEIARRGIWDSIKEERRAKKKAKGKA